MTLEIVLFTLFALIAATSSVVMITRKNPVISAIFLIINFFSLAGLYLLLNAQFISVAQVIVYAGAIMVLFLFVLMLVNPKNEDFIIGKNKIKLFAVIIAAVVFFQIAYLIVFAVPSAKLSREVAKSVEAGSVEQIGSMLYTTYLLPFEAAGFLLLAATIGALVLAKRNFD